MVACNAARRALVVACLVVCEGCSDGGARSIFEAIWRPLTGPRALSGQSAFAVAGLRRNVARPTDLDAIAALHAAEAGYDGGRRELDSPAAERLAAKLARTRLITDTRRFAKDDALYVASSGGLGAAGATAALDPDAGCGWSLDAEALAVLPQKRIVPGFDRLPVRNQVGRGTCAAFAAVGALEQLALHPSAEGSNPNLPTLDLSEQRFYWLSKPECQQDGCPGGEEGSWYGKGFSAITEAAGAALPLESACPYDGVVGATDTHHPQEAGCVGDQVRIAELGTWCGIKELLALLDQGRAVPIASRLSQNWEDNDGFITAAGAAAEGETSHAVGHAYLAVGYQRLPDHPEEGGLCLWVRNSWGTGWGDSGYACMTLEWLRRHLREHQVKEQQPTPLRLALHPDLALWGLPEPEPVPDEAWDEEEDGPLDDDKDEVIDPADDVEPLEPLEPEEDLDPDSEDERDGRGRRREDPRRRQDLQWSPVDLYGPNEAVYAAEVAVAEVIGEDDELLVRVVKLGGATTQPLRLILQGEALRYQGDEVGSRDGAVLVLCSEHFAGLCALRHRAGDDQVYVQFRDEDRRAVGADEVTADQGAWQGAELGLEVFVPHEPDVGAFLLDPKTYLRVPGGKPARLSLRPDPASPGVLELRLGGLRAGAIDLLAPAASRICSGEDAKQCRVITGQTLSVLPSNRRRR